MEFNMVFISASCNSPEFLSAQVYRHGHQRQVRQTEGLNTISKIAKKNNSANYSPHFEAKSHLTDQEIPHLNPQVQYRAHKTTQWRQSNARHNAGISNIAASR
jgi:hypothetical protein